MAAEIITIASLKRGAGKTTTATALAAAAAASGIRAIAVDLDQSGGVSAGLERTATAPTMLSVAQREATLRDALQRHPLGFDTALGDRRLGAERISGLQLRAMLGDVLDDADIVVIDTSCEEEAVAAPMQVADRTLIVAGLDILSMRGAALTAGVAQEAGVLDRVVGIGICNATQPLAEPEEMLLAALHRAGLTLETVLWHGDSHVAQGKLLLRELAMRDAPVGPLEHFVGLAQGRSAARAAAV